MLYSSAGLRPCDLGEVYSLAEVRGVVEVIAPEFVQQSRKNDVLLLLELFLAEFLSGFLPEVGGVLLPEVAE